MIRYAKLLIPLILIRSLSKYTLNARYRVANFAPEAPSFVCLPDYPGNVAHCSVIANLSRISIFFVFLSLSSLPHLRLYQFEIHASDDIILD